MTIANNTQHLALGQTEIGSATDTWGYGPQIKC
jgi:hypothetical protein